MKNLQDLAKDWTGIRRQMERSIKDITRISGVIAVKVIKENFKIQGYDSGSGVNSWPARSTKTNKAYGAGRGKGQQGIYKGSVYSASNPLLLQTKNLYNSIRYQATTKKVFIGVDETLIPYAKIQNEGGRGIPRRQYMPFPNQTANIKMLRAIQARIISERNKIMGNFKK